MQTAWLKNSLLNDKMLNFGLNFIEYHIFPAITEGYIRMLYPNSPRHTKQKYLLTVKGLALYNELTTEK